MQFRGSSSKRSRRVRTRQVHVGARTRSRGQRRDTCQGGLPDRRSEDIPPRELARYCATQLASPGTNKAFEFRILVRGLFFFPAMLQDSFRTQIFPWSVCLMSLLYFFQCTQQRKMRRLVPRLSYANTGRERAPVLRFPESLSQCSYTLAAAVIRLSQIEPPLSSFATKLSLCSLTTNRTTRKKKKGGELQMSRSPCANKKDSEIDMEKKSIPRLGERDEKSLPSFERKSKAHFPSPQTSPLLLCRASRLRERSERTLSVDFLETV